MKKDRRIEFIVWGLVLVASIFLNLGLHSRNDDFYFALALERYGSLFGWAQVYGTTWSGRIIPHGLLVLLLQLPNTVFILINSIVIVAIFHLFVQLFAPRNIRFKTLAGVVMMLSLLLLKFWNEWEITNVIHWKCSAVLYVWCIAGFFLAIRPLVLTADGKKVTRQEWVLAYAGGIYTSGFEQMAAFMLVFMLVFTIWNWYIEKKHSIDCLALSVFISVLSLLFASFPGNATRFVAETIKWKQNYGMFSLPDRILLGICLCVSFLRDHAAPLMCLASIFLVILIYKRKPKNLVLRLLALEPAAYYFLALVNKMAGSKTVSAVLGYDISFLKPFLKKCIYVLNVDSIYFHYPLSILTTSCAVFSLITFGCLLYLASGEKEYDLIKPLFFFGGCGTILLMGLSPTFRASGIRTCFICECFLMFVTIMLAWEIQALHSGDTKNPRGT